MRRWILGSIVGALASFGPLPAQAEQYNVVASAGNDGDAHVDNDDPNAFAEFFRAEGGGEESYAASADAGSGQGDFPGIEADPVDAAVLDHAPVVLRFEHHIEMHDVAHVVLLGRRPRHSIAVQPVRR